MTNEENLIGRRSLLYGGSSLAISTLLAGCSGRAGTTLRLLILRGSIPPQFVGAFQRAYAQQQAAGINLNVDTQAQLQALFSQLQTWRRSTPNPPPPSFWDSLMQWIPGVGRSNRTVSDLATLGDFWLETAIRQKLIAPLDMKSLQGWPAIAQTSQFQQLVTRNPQGQLDSNGQVWAVPYRVGTAVIAYRKDIFAQRNLQPPTDWADLWRADLRGWISLLDNPREVIGLTLKKLNQSYNVADLSSVANLKPELQMLHQQARYYSSTSYLQPLLLDDVWLALAWSTDVLPLRERNHQIGVIVPRSGTSLFADLWVRPAGNATSLPAAANQWIDFCWQRDYATQLSLATSAVSPALIGTAIDQLPQSFQDQPALLPDLETFKRSEFLLPISQATTQQYHDYWTEMRR